MSSELTSASVPVLTDGKVRRLATVKYPIEVIEATYGDYGRHRKILSIPPALTTQPEAPRAAFKAKGAHLPGRDITGYRLIADSWVDGREQTIGFCWMADAGSEQPLDLVERLWLHRFRTAMPGVVATKFPARSDARVAISLVAGQVADETPTPLRACFDLDEIRVVARRTQFTQTIARRHDGHGDVPVSACDDIAKDARGADLILTTSAAQEPILDAAHLSTGRFVCDMGGEPEFAYDGPDRVDHAQRYHRADTDLGEAVLGAKPGRTGAHEIVLAVIQGMARCDLALAHLALMGAGLASLTLSRQTKLGTS